MENVFSKYKSVIVNFFLFVFIVIFFTSVSPIFPCDGDDWYFTGSMRLPWPMWGVFNPSKVLPEIIEPLGGYFAAFVVYPFTADYVASIAGTQAVVISAFITLLFWMSFKYFHEKFSLSVSFALCIELIFFLLFFLVFKQKNQNSYYGFWSSDLNCYFNYIIPGVLNATLMLFMAKSDKFVQSGGGNKNGCIRAVLLIGIYLALFSNIQSSIILSGYCFIRFVETVIKSIRAKKQIFTVKEFWIYGAVDLFWLISLIFESSGLRAMGLTVGANGFFIMPLSESLSQYKVLFSYVGKYYSCVFLIFFVLAYLILMIDRNIREKFLVPLIRTVLLFVLVTTYLTLVHAKAGAWYGRRPDTMWPVIFLILMLTSLCVAIVFTKLKALEFCMIPMVFMLFVVAFNLNGKFIQFEQDYSTAKRINDYIIRQVVTADKAGQSKAVVKVPKGDPNAANWPYPYNMAHWFQNALFSHNIISNRISIEFVPDSSLNKILYKKNVEFVPFDDLEHD